MSIAAPARSLFVAAEPHPRSLRGPRLATWAAWAVIGALGTYVDKIHQGAGVSAYPNAEWIGELLPVSPVYVFAGVGFFALYVTVVGLRRGHDALFGGADRSPGEFIYAMAAVLAGYAVTALCGGAGQTQGWAPFVGATVLALWAAPSYWRLRHTRVPLFGVLVVVFGCGVEWLATQSGGFQYPACPSTECFGTPIPILWLPLLYAHVALFFHRLAGGPYSMLV